MTCERLHGVPTSAAPRLVLQISDLHLRRYPIHNAPLQVVILDNDRWLSGMMTWAFLKECKMACGSFPSQSFTELGYLVENLGLHKDRV